MKKILILIGLFLLTSIGFAQIDVKTQPKNFGSKLIRSTAGDFKTITTTDTTDAIDISKYRGAVTLFFVPDTVGAVPNSDSCLTITILLKNNDSGRWFKYGGVAVVDTLDRALVNVALSANEDNPQGVYYPIALSDAWALADLAKFALGIGSADKLKLKVYVEGQ